MKLQTICFGFGSRLIVGRGKWNRGCEGKKAESRAKSRRKMLLDFWTEE
jgi:hypothetical protein